jgi:hypothetical protein
MNPDEQPVTGRWERFFSGYRIWLILAPVFLFFAIVGVYYLLGGSSTLTTNPGGDRKRTEEDNLTAARQALARQTDLTTCRGALSQINSELGEQPERRPPALTQEQKDWLRQQAGLDSGELTEIDSGNYTQLDGQHLDLCFLLRDVARGLEVKGVRAANGAAVRETGPDLAARAFAWVVREVRLREHEGEAVPPAFVLRRGWGTPLERALVFLALLEQLGDPSAPQPELLSCLLYLPGDSGGERFWACGVVAGDGKDLYLFDPRLGLPIPGPKGDGIATLAELRKQPEVLTVLNIDKQRYDVTAEQARSARARLVCPLSGLSSRMRYLQDELLAPAVRVRLAVDAKTDLERIQAACVAGADKPARAEIMHSATGVLRRFLPPEEGGVDQGAAVVAGLAQRAARKDLFALELVPWAAMPEPFLDPKRFPPNIELGQRVRTQFARPFIVSAQEPGHARDLMLRGRYSSAIVELMNEQEHWREQQKQRANARDLEQRTAEWVQRAITAYAAQLRGQPGADEQVKDLWGERQVGPVLILLNSAIASARNPEITYLLGLCMQEQAEQVQARLDLQARTPGMKAHPSDVEKARAAWVDARNTWKRYAEDYPKGNERAAARRLRGRAEAMLGYPQAAAATWKDLSDDMTPLEKLASLYLAQQLEKQHAGKAK